MTSNIATTTTTTRHRPRVAKALKRLGQLFADNGWPASRAPCAAMEVLEDIYALRLSEAEAAVVAEAVRWYGRTYGGSYGDRGFPRLAAAATVAGVVPEEGTTLSGQGRWRREGNLYDSLAEGRRQHGWA